MSDPSSRRSSRFSMRSKQVGQLLQENGDVQAEQIAKALKLQEKQGGLIGQILRSINACSAEALAAALLKQVQVTDIRCEELGVEPNVLSFVTQEKCAEHRLCPFEQLGNLLCVVMANPLNRKAINEIEEASHLKVKPFKAPWAKIQELIGRSYTEENLAAAGGEAGEVGDPGDLSDPGSLDDAAAPVEIQAPLEIPADEGGEEAAPAQTPAERRKSQNEPLRQDPMIKGLDELSDGSAEMIETDKRGLRRREPRADDAPAPRAPKPLKVNVDLDSLDLDSASQVIATGEEASVDHGDMGDEIQGSAHAPRANRAPALPGFEQAPVGYFFEGDEEPEDLESYQEELGALLSELPVAEFVAENAAEYRASLAPKSAAAKPKPAPKPAPVKKEIPVENLPAPESPQKALALSDADFSKLTSGMITDPVGEWLWKTYAPGPVTVEEFDAEKA